MKIYLGIIGKSFAGKETVFQAVSKIAPQLIANCYVSIHHFSDPLNEALDLFRLEKTRPNQQKLSTIMRQAFGEELLGNVIAARASADSSDVVCLDGIRRPRDVVRLKQFPNSYLVFVDASTRTRFERGQKRTDRPSKTWQEFQAEQSAEAESKIDEIAKEADVIFDNSSTPKFLEDQVERFLLEVLKEEGAEK